MGQDSGAEDLLASPSERVKIALPDICVMEAISAFDWKRGDRNRLKGELDRQLAQLQRSIEIPVAQRLAKQLTQVDFTNAEFLSDLFHRLDTYLVRLAERAELIPLSNAVLLHQFQLRQQTELDRDDALILASILDHSLTDTVSSKALLTGNIHDFRKKEVALLLRQNRMKHFSSSDQLLRWLRR
jgi:hypothetical protein